MRYPGFYTGEPVLIVMGRQMQRKNGHKTSGLAWVMKNGGCLRLFDIPGSCRSEKPRGIWF